MQVIFPQGRYYLNYLKTSAEALSRGLRYHNGLITRIYIKDSVTLYDGHHLETPETSAKKSFRSYTYEFTGLLLTELRLAPTAMDTIVAAAEL